MSKADVVLFAWVVFSLINVIGASAALVIRFY